MERTNFVRGSSGVGRCRALCRFLIELGADFLGLPEEEDREGVCWWDDLAELSHSSLRTRDRSLAHMEEHWVDNDLSAQLPAWRPVASSPQAAVSGVPAARAQCFAEVEIVKEKSKEKFEAGVRKHSCQSGIARFLKLGGAISGDRGQRRLVFSTIKESVHVPLIRTDESLYADYP